MVAVELEILAKKFDRFGWDRDRGTAAHDGMIRDWIDALCDFPLSEVRAACRAAVLENPSKMPNEGHIRAQIMASRAAAARANMAARPRHEEATQREDVTPEVLAERRAAAARIMAEVFQGKSVGGDV